MAPNPSNPWRSWQQQPTSSSTQPLHPQMGPNMPPRSSTPPWHPTSSLFFIKIHPSTDPGESLCFHKPNFLELLLVVCICECCRTPGLPYVFQRKCAPHPLAQIHCVIQVKYVFGKLWFSIYMQWGPPTPGTRIFFQRKCTSQQPPTPVVFPEVKACWVQCVVATLFVMRPTPSGFLAFFLKKRCLTGMVLHSSGKWLQMFLWCGQSLPISSKQIRMLDQHP